MKNASTKAALYVQRPDIGGFNYSSNCSMECGKTRWVTTEKFVFI